MCEGDVNEPQYLKGFQAWSKNPLVRVTVAGGEGDPSHVVKRAKSLKSEAEIEARREKDENLLFDDVWCLVDVDDHKRLEEVADMAKSNGIELGISNPCFELWLVLHFRESPGPQDRKFIQAMVGEFVEGYEKHVDFALFKTGYEEAVKRARCIDDDCRKMGELGRNPSTGVYRLTEAIRTFSAP